MHDLPFFYTKIVLCIFLMSFLTSATHAQLKDRNFLNPTDGLKMQRQGNYGILDFHRIPRSQANPQTLDFFYMRPDSSSNLNNIILTAQGQFFIGMEDICGGFASAVPTIPEASLILNRGHGVQYGDGTWTTISDQRLKKNIQPLAADLQILKKIKFYEFEYNGLAGTPTGKKYYGVMAQEVQDLLPSTVGSYHYLLHPSDEQPTELLTYNPNDLMYTFFNGTKALILKTEKLEKENQTLASENEVLKQELHTLKENLAKEQTTNEAQNKTLQVIQQQLNRLLKLPVEE